MCVRPFTVNFTTEHQMPGDQTQRNRRLVELNAGITALAILQRKRSEVVIYGAHRQAIAAAMHEAADHQQFANQLGQAMQDIKIVAATGIAACFGALVISQLLARSYGVAYASFRLATPVVAQTVTVATPLGTSIQVTSSNAIRLSVTSFITAQLLQTVLLRVPVGRFLQRYVGDSALSRFVGLIKDEWNETEFSPADFEDYRDGLLATSVGTDRHRAILRDPNVRSDVLRTAMREMAEQLVSQMIADLLMAVETPANGLLLMSDSERNTWYQGFEQNIRTYINDNHADLSEDEKIMLSTNLKYEFWNEVNAQMESQNRRWHGLLRDLRRDRRNIDLTMENIMGGGR
jgi:hypothetical protein